MDQTLNGFHSGNTWAEQLLLSIFNRFPPSDVIFKKPESRPSAEYTDEVQNPFTHWFSAGPEMIAGRDVLDLGCGFGGRPVRFAEIGARSVTGVEISEELVSHAKEFARSSNADNVRFFTGTGENIPTADSQFDLVTMVDVMEHVVSPEAVLRECWRVLRPGGCLAAVFPPYYAIRSGSHLHGYATSFPGLNLFFPTQTLKTAATSLLRKQGIRLGDYFREVPTDKLWNMNGLTIRHFRKLVRQTSFQWEKSYFIGEYDRRVSKRTGLGFLVRSPIYMAFEIGTKLPLVREAVTARVCALLRK